MYRLRYFPRIEEFDARTNQVRLLDKDGISWIAPVPYFGVIRTLPLDTPCLLITWEGFTKSRTEFDDRVSLNCIAFPVYNSNRFDAEEVSIGPSLVGSVSDSGKITTGVKAEAGGVTVQHGPESVVVSDRTYVPTLELSNADVSYGGFSKPQPYFLRYRPDFPYGLTEMVPYGRLVQYSRRISKAFQELGGL